MRVATDRERWEYENMLRAAPWYMLRAYQNAKKRHNTARQKILVIKMWALYLEPIYDALQRMYPGATREEAKTIYRLWVAGMGYPALPGSK